MRFMSIIGLCLMAVFALVQGIPVQEQGKPAQPSQAARIRQDIEAQRQQLRELQAEVHALQSEKDRAQRVLTLAQQHLEQLTGQTQQAHEQHDRLAVQLQNLERQLEQARKVLADIEQASMQEEQDLTELRVRSRNVRHQRPPQNGYLTSRALACGLHPLLHWTGRLRQVASACTAWPISRPGGCRWMRADQPLYGHHSRDGFTRCRQ
jgi:hypothetical protein